MGLIKIYPSVRLHARIGANARACIPKKKIPDYVVELLELHTPKTITFADEQTLPSTAKASRKQGKQTAKA